MHTIRANLYWEFQFVLGYIAVPRSRIRPGNPLRVGRGKPDFRKSNDLGGMDLRLGVVKSVSEHHPNFIGSLGE
jgi:hypothetical protein